jgi:hypothetical protein
LKNKPAINAVTALLIYGLNPTFEHCKIRRVDSATNRKTRNLLVWAVRGHLFSRAGE